MSTIYKTCFALLLTFLLVAPASAQFSTFVVDDDGDPATTYPSLAQAIATAEAFAGGPHRIEIREGTYNDYGIVFTTSTKIGEIVGDGDDVVLFEAPAGSYQAVNFMDVGGTDDLTISGITVKGYVYGIYNTEVAGQDVDGITITDCVFDDNGEDGYNAPGPDYLDDGAAIYLYDCDDGTFENLEIKNGEAGLRLDDFSGDGSDGNDVLACTVYDNEQYGIGLFQAATNNTIDGCEVYNHTNRGIVVGSGGGGGNAVTNCLVYDNANDGILFSNVISSTITDNTVYGNAYTTAIFSDPGTKPVHGGITVVGTGSTGNQILDNVVYANGDGAGTGDYGVWLEGFGNTITGNCLYNHDGIEGYSAGADTWDGNYYEDLDATVGTYTLDGAGAVVDANPMLYDNSADGPTTVDVLGTVSYDFNWTVPACAVDDSVYLAAYEFTVNWDPTKLEYVSADYDEGYLGNTAGGALYTPIGGDPATGTLTFAAANFTTPGLGDGRLAFAEFNAIDVGAVSITISSDYRDPNGVAIPTGNTPLAVTIQDAEVPVVVSVTPNNPIGDDTYSNFVGLEVEAQATDNFDLRRIQYQWNGAGSWYLLVGSLSGTSGGTTAPVALVTTGLTEGANVLNVRAQDQAGNYSAVVDYNFTIDRTGPVLSTVLATDLDGCAVDVEYTNDPTINVAITDDGTATQMEFSYGSGWEGPIAYANPTTYTIGNTTDNTYPIYVRLYDAYGNVGNNVIDNITLDQVAPTPSALVLDGGAAKTNTTSINADAAFDAPGGAVEFLWSEDPADLVCASTGWMAAPQHPFPVTLSAGDGLKTVHFAVRDNAGNISAIITDDITLDTDAPEITSFTVADLDGDDCSDNWTVEVTVEWTATDVQYLYLGTATGVYGAPIDISAETSPYTTNYTISGGTCNALNTIFAVIEDDITNQGTEVSDDVFVDCSAPSIASIVLSDVTTASTMWSTSATVDVTLSGFDLDIVEVQMGEVTGTYTETVAFDPNDPVVQFTFAAPTNVDYLYLVGVDCAGRTSTEVVDGMYFDLIDPTVADVEIDGGATLTNSTTVSVDFTWVEVYPDEVMLSEDPTFTDGTTVTEPWAGGPPYAYTISSGDGLKTVYVRLIDMSGRESAAGSDDITLDQTPPSGAMTLVSVNPLAAAGYTSTQNVMLENITWDADVTDMRFRNTGTGTGGTAATGYMAVATSYGPWQMLSGEGIKTVEVRFRDAAMNQSAWIPFTIDWSSAVPSPPALAWGAPGGSTVLGWQSGAEDQLYHLRYNFTNDYPLYPNDTAPHPLTRGEGIFEAEVADTFYDFEGPHADIYSFSIWTLSNYGVWSAVPNVDVYATNYVLGDFYDSENELPGPDGCIDFGDEFGELAIAYSSYPADGNWNPELDIAPTSDFSPSGYPIPDGYVGFEDLIIFALNYDAYRCSAAKRLGDIVTPPFKMVTDPVILSAEIPALVDRETEVTVAVMVDNPAVIKGYHIIFDYNEADFELVKVEPGEIFQSVEQSFFFYEQDSENIDVTGVVFGADAAFAGDEMFRFTVRAKNRAGLELDDLELTIRDRENKDVTVSFSQTLSNGMGLPTQFALSQNYPNPFNPTTTIEMALPTASNYELAIYNVLGQVVTTFEGYAEAGFVTIHWDAAEQSSGVYLYKMSAGNFEATKKMVLLK